MLGTLLPAVAAELGARPSGHTPVVCGVPDLHTAAIGPGAVHDFAGHIAISTTAWVSAPVPFKKTDVARQMASVPGLRAGSYLIANNHETGGAALRWLRDLEIGDGATYDELTTEAASRSRWQRRRDLLPVAERRTVARQRRTPAGELPQRVD